jgi:hypothetical protein
MLQCFVGNRNYFTSRLKNVPTALPTPPPAMVFQLNLLFFTCVVLRGHVRYGFLFSTNFQVF